MLRRVVALTFGATILLSTAITSFAAASPQSIVRSLAIQAHKQIAKEFPGEAHLPIKVSCDRHTGSRAGSLIGCSVYTIVGKFPVISGFTYTTSKLPVGITSYTYKPPVR